MEWNLLDVKCLGADDMFRIRDPGETKRCSGNPKNRGKKDGKLWECGRTRSRRQEGFQARRARGFRADGAPSGPWLGKKEILKICHRNHVVKKREE